MKHFAWRMGVRAARAVILVLVPLVTLAVSTLPKDWNHWRYSRAIELPATDAARLAEVTIADEIYTHSRLSLQDLRVINDQGNETPYTEFRLDGAKKSESLLATVRENSFTPGKYTQVVIEITGNAPFHNAVEIETVEQNFIEWVGVDASDDARVWRIVQERAPIFRFAKEGRDGTRVVHYSENNARYLRVSIFDGEKQFPIFGAALFHETTGPAERRPLDVQITPDAHPPAGQSIWTVDMPGGGVPVSEAHFTVAPMEFIRRVNISARDDNREWNMFASGQIYRFHQGEKVQEQLVVPVSNGDVRGRHWRITVENGNDARLVGAEVQLYTTPRHLVFEQQPGRSYELIYGQERADAAQYDLGRRVDMAQQQAAIPGRIGPEEANTAWVDPQPWTETHAVFLWGVMLLAVLVIGYTAIQSMRRAASTPEA